MPCEGSYYYGFWEKNPRLWEKLKLQVSKDMLAEGWSKYARKFDTVRDKRARKLFK